MRASLIDKDSSARIAGVVEAVTVDAVEVFPSSEIAQRLIEAESTVLGEDIRDTTDDLVVSVEKSARTRSLAAFALGGVTTFFASNAVGDVISQTADVITIVDAVLAFGFAGVTGTMIIVGSGQGEGDYRKAVRNRVIALEHKIRRHETLGLLSRDGTTFVSDDQKQGQDA
jgi:hypothetical protein